MLGFGLGVGVGVRLGVGVGLGLGVGIGVWVWVWVGVGVGIGARVREERGGSTGVSSLRRHVPLAEKRLRCTTSTGGADLVRGG